ncbi:MAG: 2-dehydropantoate 2-reductase [Ardenticatenaceae bacterium]|nr:2-dehydropantoate 2-reductase [Ardenticatenaceae bacterium]
MITAIVGVGALGSLFAARLVAVTPVLMIGHWIDHLQQIEHHGLELIELDGQSSHHPIPVSRQFHQLKDRPIDRVLVLVKGPQTAAAAEDIARILPAGGQVLTLQNGLGNREILKQNLPTADVQAGTTAQGATVVAPGIVRHAGNGKTYLPPAAADWASLFDLAGIPVEIDPNVEAIIWKKLIVNAGINPLSAILNQPNGFLAENPEARVTMMQAAREAAQVAAAVGISLTYDDSDNPAKAVLEVARQTAGNLSSMVQDVRRGVKTEIESITGVIVRLGQKYGVKVPVNQELYRQVLEIEAA